MVDAMEAATAPATVPVTEDVTAVRCATVSAAPRAASVSASVALLPDAATAVRPPLAAVTVARLLPVVSAISRSRSKGCQPCTLRDLERCNCFTSFTAVVGLFAAESSTYPRHVKRGAAAFPMILFSVLCFVFCEMISCSSTKSSGSAGCLAQVIGVLLRRSVQPRPSATPARDDLRASTEIISAA